MTTAYIVNGIKIGIAELTCPNGHTNANLELGSQELNCEFVHYGKLIYVVDKKAARSEFDRLLLAEFGAKVPVTTLAHCRICNTGFWHVRYDDVDEKYCQCVDCEIDRLKRRKAPEDEAIYKLMPVTAKRLAAGLPECGLLTERQQERLEHYQLPLRGARWEPREIGDLPAVKDLEEVPF